MRDTFGTRHAYYLATWTFLVAVALALSAAAAAAQSSFGVLRPPSDGTPLPVPLTVGADGNLYGITGRFLPGGDPGRVVRMTPAGALTTLHLFSDVEGVPVSLISGADGHLYGISTRPEESEIRRLFRLRLDGTFAILWSGTGVNPMRPGVPLLQAPNGALYLFPPVPESVVTFSTQGSYGQTSAHPNFVSVVRALDGDFYGPSTNHPTGLPHGSIVRMTPDGPVNFLHAFTGGTDGGRPQIIAETPSGDFVGVTATGGEYDAGTIFRLTTAGQLTTLHSFWVNPRVTSLVGGSDGTVHGTTAGSFSGNLDATGSIFRMSPSGDITVLSSGGVRGMAPGRLTTGADGLLYGNTGGDLGVGAFYRLEHDGSVRLLQQFWARGSFRAAALVRSDAMSFYGVTSPGRGYGDFGSGYGAVFRTTRTGTFDIVHAFRGWDGTDPRGLLRARDGALYGTTSVGGASAQGTVFRIGTDGRFSVLHHFLGDDGGQPLAALIQARDGHFYGTTNGGGEHQLGTAFRITADGDFSVIHHFAGGPTDGAYPTAALVEASDGHLYGTTVLGGATGRGTVFQLGIGGAFRILHDGVILDQRFPLPVDALVEGRDGRLYGVTRGCHSLALPSGTLCSDLEGTFFRVSLNGDYEILRRFPAASHDFPESPLLQANDGSFYGVAANAIVRITQTGALTRVQELSAAALVSGVDLTRSGGILQAEDGRFYCFASGLRDAVFGLRLFPHPPVAVRAASGPQGTVLSWTPSGAATYTVVRRLGNEEVTIAQGLAETTFTDLTAVPYAAYAYVVWAVHADGASVPAAAIVARATLLPVSRTPTNRTVADYDGDGLADFSVYRSSSGVWYTRHSSVRGAESLGWGSPALDDRPVPADYDGDGSTDVAVYRETTGTWVIHLSSTGATMQAEWGMPLAGDVPVPADYDGDGQADIAVYSTTSGEWHIRPSAGTAALFVSWGAPHLGDLPVPGDFDGDGAADVAVYRASTGGWFVRQTGAGSPASVAWGAPVLGDVPVPADYDGDGITDVAVHRGATGEWLIRRSTTGALWKQAWGAPHLGDVPVPADYDGDGRTDLAVYRSSTGQWFVQPSSSQTPMTLMWGSPAHADTVQPF